MEVARLLDALPLPCLMVAASTRISACNDAARALLGADPVGRSYIAVLRRPAVAGMIEACLRDAAPRDTAYMTSEGTRDVIYRVTCRAVAGTGDVVVSFEDITRLEEAGQMRRDFIANVSHELRTPLTALIGFIDTLRGPARDDAEARARFLAIMEGEAARMNRLVGDLLSLSRVEDQERVRPTRSVTMTDVLGTTLHALRPVADEAGVTLDLRSAPEAIALVADFDQLVQVFANLVENAIKYGGSGRRVEVTESHLARDAGIRGPAVCVRVRDFGPGIDPVHLPRLTERFYRADSHRSRQLGGTGLGLAIVKHILNRHRGRLKMESKLGQGSVFTVILPCLPVTGAETRASS